MAAFLSLTGSILAISQRADILSLVGQLGSFFVAIVVGRTVCKSKSAIVVAAVLGGLGAIVSHVLVDGQGACVLMGFAPIIYLFSVAGRHDLYGSDPSDRY
jgi:membrane-bound metal-dependent hydrolase YbcI (DUF457 family)